MTGAPSPVIQLARARVQTGSGSLFFPSPTPRSQFALRASSDHTCVRSLYPHRDTSPRDRSPATTPLGYSMCKDQPAMTSDMQQTPRSRRNGMGNIFDGIDPALYMRLGLSKTEEEEEEKTSSGCSSEYEEEEQQQLCLSEILGEMGGWARQAQQDKAGVACWEQLEILGCLQGSDTTDPGCCGGDGSGPCRPRSFSCTLELDVCSSLAHRRRRNAMADLFSSLSPAQREALLALAASSSPAPAFPPTPVSPAVPPESAPQVKCS